MVHEDNGFPNAQTRLPYFLVIRSTTNLFNLDCIKFRNWRAWQSKREGVLPREIGNCTFIMVNTTNTIVHFTPWLSSICVTESEMSLVKLGFSDIISKLKFSFCQNTLNLVGLQLNFCLIGGAAEKTFKTAKYCA